MLNIIRTTVEKNQCYKNCFEFLKLNPAWTLVHGIASLHGCGVRYGHAWCELKIKNALRPTNPILVVYDVSADIAVDFRAYYEAGMIRPKEVFKYNYEEALRMWAAVGHEGPWAKKVAKAASLETHTLDGKKRKRT